MNLYKDRILKEPQNQSYRNFLSIGGSQRVPSHNRMSDFRTKVGVERFYQILFQIIAQALKLEGFLNSVISAIDSRPLFANVGRPGKKHCNCSDKKNCSCERTFTDPDAAVGRMRNKTIMYITVVAWEWWYVAGQIMELMIVPMLNRYWIE